MSRVATTYRPIRHRTLGSGTRLVDEFQVPFAAYHGGRALRGLWRRRRGAGITALVVTFWSMTGSLVGGLLVTGLVLAGGLTAWVGWKSRTAEGGSFHVRDALAATRQKQRLEQQWPLACKRAGLRGPDGGDVPALRRLRSTGDGSLEATVRSGDIGVPVPDVEKAAGTIAEIVGCQEVVVAHVGPGVAKLTFHWRDPIGRVLPLADLPVAPQGRLAYGIRQDGSVASVKATQSVLIGGLTRHGKSNTVWTLLADALRQGIPVDLYVSDPKGGVELDAFEPMVRELPRRPDEPRRPIEVRQYVKSAAETVKMLDTVEKAMHCRQRDMKATGTRQVAPNEKNPLVVVILDETLVLTDLLKKGQDSPLGRIAYTGAAAAYVVWANTQAAQVDVIGRFRDFLPQRICYATPNPQVTDSVLGQGSESSGAACSRIKVAGVGYSTSEGEQAARRFRGALVSDDEVKAIAAGKLPQSVMDRAQILTQESEARSKRSADPGATALYRFYRKDDPPGARPSYIGISVDPLQRLGQHESAARAFLAEGYRMEAEWWPTRRSALKAEKEAIQREMPLYNLQHNMNNRFRKVDLRQRSKTAA